MAPREFCNRGEVRYGFIEGLEYEVPQSRLYCLCINVALCSTICRVIRRSSMTMKAHTYYIIFGRPPMGGSFPRPLAAPLSKAIIAISYPNHFQCFTYLMAAKTSLHRQEKNYVTVTLCWRRGIVVNSVRHMNKVNARRVRLVPGWVTIFVRVYHLGM